MTRQETTTARQSRELKSAFASLARLRAALEAALDAGDMDTSRRLANAFGDQARRLRHSLAAHLPETTPPPDAIFTTDVLSVTDDAVRLTLPDHLHAAMFWLKTRRRAVLAALGEGRRRMRRFCRLTLCLTLTVALLVGARELWRAVERHLELKARSNFTVDLVNAPEALPRDFKVNGLLSTERNEGHVWRWGLGPQTLVAFVLYEPRVVRLSLRLSNPVPGQTITIAANGKPTAWELPDAKLWMRDQDTFSLNFQGVIGLNTVTLTYRLFNQSGMAFAPDNATPFAAAYTDFHLSTERQ